MVCEKGVPLLRNPLFTFKILKKNTLPVKSATFKTSHITVVCWSASSKIRCPHHHHHQWSGRARCPHHALSSSFPAHHPHTQVASNPLLVDELEHSFSLLLFFFLAKKYFQHTLRFYTIDHIYTLV